jgi:L-arabinose isomerase
VTTEPLRDFAAMSGIEFLAIDEHTAIDAFGDHLRWNDLYYLLVRGL